MLGLDLRKRGPPLTVVGGEDQGHRYHARSSPARPDAVLTPIIKCPR